MGMRIPRRYLETDPVSWSLVGRLLGAAIRNEKLDSLVPTTRWAEIERKLRGFEVRASDFEDPDRLCLLIVALDAQSRMRSQDGLAAVVRQRLLLTSRLWEWRQSLDLGPAEYAGGFLLVYMDEMILRRSATKRDEGVPFTPRSSIEIGRTSQAQVESGYLSNSVGGVAQALWNRAYSSESAAPLTGAPTDLHPIGLLAGVLEMDRPRDWNEVQNILGWAATSGASDYSGLIKTLDIPLRLPPDTDLRVYPTGIRNEIAVQLERVGVLGHERRRLL
jgi:hypothetical protein